MRGYSQYLKNYNWFNSNAIDKSIIDTIGIKGNLLHVKNSNLDKYKIMGIEAKASYQDFLNGFCCQCEYTYIIAPEGVIPLDKMPDKIGLIEVDLDNYSIKRRYGKFEFKGIETVKQCKSRKKDLYKKDDMYRIDTFNTLREIAYRSTVNDLFKNNEIMIEGL